jgi:peptidoglycan/LPS O-acetylase OafA/YrhL
MAIVFSLTLYVGPNFRGFIDTRKWGDLSYGIFIYGMPAQQLVQGAGTGLGPVIDTMIAIALALCFAALSWFLVEHPALRMRHAIAGLLSLGRRARRPILPPSTVVPAAPSPERETIPATVA